MINKHGFPKLQIFISLIFLVFREIMRILDARQQHAMLCNVMQKLPSRERF